MHPYTGKTSKHRALTKVKRVMPDTPEKRAHVQKISDSSQVSQILARKGALINKHVKRKIKMDEAVMKSLKLCLSQTKKIGTQTREKQYIHEILKYAAMVALSKKYKLQSKLRISISLWKTLA